MLIPLAQLGWQSLLNIILVSFRSSSATHSRRMRVKLIGHEILRNRRVLPIINEKAVPVYLVLQGEVKSEVFNAFIVVDLHFGGILISLKVFDDIREPNGQAIIPANKTPGLQVFKRTTVWE